MPAELPGFYYDEEKGRYFSIAAGATPGANARHNGRELKKRKVKKQREESAINVESKRRDTFKRYIYELIDPIEREFGVSDASNFIEGLKIESGLHDGSKSHNLRINRSFGAVPQHHEITKHLLFELDSRESFRLAFATRNGQIESVSHSPGSGNDFGIIELNNYLPEGLQTGAGLEVGGTGYKPLRLEGSSFAATGLFCHMTEQDTGRHLFARVRRTEVLKQDLRVKQFAAHENVHDSLDLGENFVVAVGSSLILYSWKKSVEKSCNKFELSKKKSDILCLASGTRDCSSIEIFAGCRDGSIYAIKLLLGGAQKIISKKCFKLPGVRSILSMKTTGLSGILFVSAVSNEFQSLFMLDIFLEPSQCKIVTFDTSFCNMTREDEVFDVTDDGRYLIYGSTASHNGLGDFEVFSSTLADNLVNEKCGNMIRFFPLKTLRKDIIRYPDLEGMGLRAVGFGTFASYHDSHTSSGIGFENNSSRCSRLDDKAKLFIILRSSTSSTALFLPSMVLISVDII